MKVSNRHDSGFSLVELMVVVLIIAILLAIGVPTFLGARQRAQDRTTQANLTTGVKAEASYAAANTGFTAVLAELQAEEPSLDWTGATDESIHFVVGDVVPGDNAQVLLYSISSSGTWFGIKLVVAGASAGRYTCSGSIEANVDELTDCMGTDW